MISFLCDRLIKIFSQLGHTVVSAPGTASSVVCCLRFSWRKTGTMLRLCLLFRNAPSGPAQRTQLALASNGDTRELIICALSLSFASLSVKSGRFFPRLHPGRSEAPVALPVAGLAATGLTGSYCSVRDYHSHGLLAA